MDRKAKLLGSGSLNFDLCAARERWPTPNGMISIHFNLLQW